VEVLDLVAEIADHVLERDDDLVALCQLLLQASESAVVGSVRCRRPYHQNSCPHPGAVPLRPHPGIHRCRA